jgi:hypothetical protein
MFSSLIFTNIENYGVNDGYPMEKKALKTVNSCWSSKITSYFETSGDQNYFPYLAAFHFFNTT